MAEVVDHLLKLADGAVGECAGDDESSGAGGVLVEIIGVALLTSGPPDAIAHEVGVEHVGSDKEGVVLFEGVGELVA